MYYAPLSNLDLQLATAASRLEMHLSMLPEDVDIDDAIDSIHTIAIELGGTILFDLRAGENINHDMHWVAIQFVRDGSESTVHILRDEFGERFWIGQEQDLPERYARLARTFSSLETRHASRNRASQVIVGSIH